MCMYMCLCECTPCVGAWMLDSLELELQAVICKLLYLGVITKSGSTEEQQVLLTAELS